MKTKWRKKPVVIESMILENTRDSIVEAIEWVYSIGMETSVSGLEASVKYVQDVGGLTIPTLEGEIKASFGDYIIKGVKGEFYPCKPDIFALLYDRELLWDENLNV